MKLCKELINELCETIKNGGTEKDAYTLANVAESTYFLWKQKGKEYLEKPETWKGKTKPLEVELLENIKQAVSDFKLWHIRNIMNHSKKSWAASAWLLQHKFPKEFGDNVELDDADKERITKIKVEYVDNKDDKSQERLKNMDQLVKDEVLGKHE